MRWHLRVPGTGPAVEQSRSGLPSVAVRSLGRWAAHRQPRGDAPAAQWRECHRAHRRVGIATQSHFGFSFFFSLSCNCNSYYVSHTCYVLLTFHPFFLSCITALLALLPQCTEAETEVSEGEDSCEILWPGDGRTSLRSEVCAAPRPSPPPRAPVFQTVTDHWLWAAAVRCG